MSQKQATDEPVSWEPNPEPSALAGVLTIGTGRRAGVYAVTELSCDQGRGFGLAKMTVGTDAEATGYAVRVTVGGTPLGCECRGWLRWNACRHAREIGALVSSGQL